MLLPGGGNLGTPGNIDRPSAAIMPATPSSCYEIITNNNALWIWKSEVIVLVVGSEWADSIGAVAGW